MFLNCFALEYLHTKYSKNFNNLFPIFWTISWNRK